MKVKVDCDKDSIQRLLVHIRKVAKDRFIFEIPKELHKYAYASDINRYDDARSSIITKYNNDTFVQTIEDISEYIDNAGLTKKGKIKMRSNRFHQLDGILLDFFILFEPVQTTLKHVYKGIKSDYFERDIMNNNMYLDSSERDLDSVNGLIEKQDWFDMYLIADDYMISYIFKYLNAAQKLRKGTA